MGITDVFYGFQTQEQAVEYLERARWANHPICPYCKQDKVCRHVSGDRKGQRWQCQKCTRAFSVTVGTIFHRTHVPLRDWFLVLAMMLGLDKPPSAYRVALDLGMRPGTVERMVRLIRSAVTSDPEQAQLLSRLVGRNGGDS
jgi:transposase-like protein